MDICKCMRQEILSTYAVHTQTCLVVWTMTYTMYFLPPVVFSLLLHAKAIVDGIVLAVPAETSRPGVLSGVY